MSLSDRLLPRGLGADGFDREVVFYESLITLCDIVGFLIHVYQNLLEKFVSIIFRI